MLRCDGVSVGAYTHETEANRRLDEVLQAGLNGGWDIEQLPLIGYDPTMTATNRHSRGKSSHGQR